MYSERILKIYSSPLSLLVHLVANYITAASSYEPSNDRSTPTASNSSYDYTSGPSDSSTCLGIICAAVQISCVRRL